MVCALYSLKKQYLDRKIYIWNINRDSIRVFTELAFRRIDIQGFITLQEEYKGEIYMNRPVFTLNQVEWDDDSIIFVSDEVSKDKISMLNSERVVYWSDAIGINNELRQKRIIIYDVGSGVDKLCKELAKEKIDVELYCVTKKNNADEYRGKKIIEATELGDYEDCAVIISVKTSKYRREILERLSDYRGQVYIENFFLGSRWSEDVLMHINFMQIIDNAFKNNKKIYLYSKKNLLAQLIEDVLNIYDIKISGYVNDSEDKTQDIISIYELAYSGVEDKLIIINEEFPEHLVRARENIELAGFSLEKGNYTGIQWYTRAKESLLLELEYYKDSLVGDNYIYPQGKPGWKVYGKEKEDDINIIVLGGSTSAEVYHPENWVSRLYYKLKQNNIKVTIYNGAFEGNGIVEEILRLLRDGHILKPNIVISLSGVNNISYKKHVDNQFNVDAYIDWIKSSNPDAVFCGGVCCKESLYSFWSRNVSLLKLISEFYGAKFFCFLQPINLSVDNMTLREKSLYEMEEYTAGIGEFEQFAYDNEDYINLLKLFEHKEDMIFDFCHYTGMAHEIIANIIYETVIPTIQSHKGS